MSAEKKEYAQDGPEAVKIASTIAYYPFHGIERFYDISGMLSSPEAFQLCIDIFVERYSDSSSLRSVDVIAGLDARGFILGNTSYCSLLPFLPLSFPLLPSNPLYSVLGPPIALALKKPFVMIRKKGKLPNAITGAEYFKEYQGLLFLLLLPLFNGSLLQELVRVEVMSWPSLALPSSRAIECSSSMISWPLEGLSSPPVICSPLRAQLSSSAPAWSSSRR